MNSKGIFFYIHCIFINWRSWWSRNFWIYFINVFHRNINCLISSVSHWVSCSNRNWIFIIKIIINWVLIIRSVPKTQSTTIWIYCEMLLIIASKFRPGDNLICIESINRSGIFFNGDWTISTCRTWWSRNLWIYFINVFHRNINCLISSVSHWVSCSNRNWIFIIKIIINWVLIIRSVPKTQSTTIWIYCEMLLIIASKFRPGDNLICIESINRSGIFFNGDCTISTCRTWWSVDGWESIIIVDLNKLC